MLKQKKLGIDQEQESSHFSNYKFTENKFQPTYKKYQTSSSTNQQILIFNQQMSNMIMWNTQKKQSKEVKNRPRKIQVSFSNNVRPEMKTITSRSLNSACSTSSNPWPSLNTGLNQTRTNKSIFSKEQGPSSRSVFDSRALPGSIFDEETKKKFSIAPRKETIITKQPEESSDIINSQASSDLQMHNTPKDVSIMLSTSVIAKREYNSVVIDNFDLGIMNELDTLAIKTIKALTYKWRIDIDESEITRVVIRKKHLLATSLLPINMCTTVFKLAQPVHTTVNCTYFKSTNIDRGVANMTGASQIEHSHAVTYCMLPDDFFAVDEFVEILACRRFPTQLCHKIRQDISDKLFKIGDMSMIIIVTNHTNGYATSNRIELSSEPTLVVLVPSETQETQIQQFYDELNVQFQINFTHGAIPNVQVSDNLTIIPIEVGLSCSHFHNVTFKPTGDFNAIAFDGLKPATQMLEILQSVTTQIPLDQIKWIIPTSFQLRSQIEVIICTTNRITTFDPSTMNHLTAPKVKVVKMMGYDHLIKNFANSGRKAVALHESDRDKFLSAKAYPITIKTPESNAISELIKNVEQLKDKVDMLMLQLSSLSTHIEQVRLYPTTEHQINTTTSNSPARKMPAHTRTPTIQVLTLPAETDQDMDT